MNLKEYIELKEEDLSKMQEKGATYKEYTAAVLKSFGLDPKTPIFKLSPKQKKKLDAGWTSKEEKEK